MIWRLGYRLLLWLLFPWVLMHLWWRGRRQRGYREHIPERFGWYQAQPARPVIWLHAVSVGETRAAEPLVRALAARYPGHELLLTQMTPTGREAAQQLFGGMATIVYLPYDYCGAVARFLARFKPRLGILMETEIWFNLVECCAPRVSSCGARATSNFRLPVTSTPCAPSRTRRSASSRVCALTAARPRSAARASGATLS